MWNAQIAIVGKQVLKERRQLPKILRLKVKRQAKHPPSTKNLQFTAKTLARESV